METSPHLGEPSQSVCLSVSLTISLPIDLGYRYFKATTVSLSVFLQLVWIISSQGGLQPIFGGHIHLQLD